jgi:tRNA (Thr-GGU) A37 N-methylase
MLTDEYALRPIGYIRSTLRSRDEAPRQGSEGAPDAWLEVDPSLERALFGISEGHEVIVITIGVVCGEKPRGGPGRMTPLGAMLPKARE